MPPDPFTLERPWIAGYPPGVPPTYRIPQVGVPRFLDDAVRDFPHRPALVTPRVTLDHVRVAAAVTDLAALLRVSGVEPGQCVVVALPNGASLPLALLAVWRVGAVAVPVASTSGVDRLRAILAVTEPSALVVTPTVLQRLDGADIARPDGVVAIEGDDWLQRTRLPRPDRLLGQLTARRRRRGLPVGVLTPASLDHTAVDHHGLPAPPAPDDLALLAFRPESDPPRGVELTHANLVAGAFQARLWIPDVQAGHEVVLVADPLNEVRTLSLGLLLGLLVGATVIVLDGPDAATLAKAIERHRPTLFATTPARLRDLLDHGDAAKRDLTSLRVVLAGGASLDAQLAADLERRTGGARVREVFGLTEAAPITHAQPVYGRTTPRAMGLPVTSTVAAIVDPDHLDVLLEPGEPGLLLVTGPQIARGYWREPDATTASFPGAWLVTGDLATVDDEGVFRHLGHRSEVVRRDGVLLAPRRIEAVLERHREVVRAGVVAVDGAVVAAVVARRRRRARVDELVAHCAAELDDAVPDEVVLVDRLPETSTGALDRAALIEQLRADAARSAAANETRTTRRGEETR